jgi:hypothetical protein
VNGGVVDLRRVLVVGGGENEAGSATSGSPKKMPGTLPASDANAGTASVVAIGSRAENSGMEII